MKRMFIGGVVLLCLIFLTTFYTLQEWEQAVIVRLGEPVRVIKASGLHMRIPLVEKIYRFDKRILPWDGDPERIPTKDNKFIFVDTFARWKIEDPLRFYKTVVDERGAQSRLDDILDGSVRDIVTAYPLIEIVRTSDRQMEISEVTEPHKGMRDEITMRIKKEVTQKLKGLSLGIELVDVQVKRIDYTEQVQAKVFDRMISQQQKIAEKYRAQGQGRKAEIQGKVERKRREITSEAYRKVQEIKGKADAEATDIYAKAYNKDKELYRFLKTLETYKTSFSEKDTLILTTDSELYRYLSSARPGKP